MKLDHRQKQIAIAAAGMLALLLIYRAWANRASNQNTAATSGGTTSAPDTASSDYAALAGQEQGDVAGLQGQNMQLQGDLSTLGTQEAADVSGLQAAIAGLTASPTATVASLATGTTPVNRTRTARHVNTHRKQTRQAQQKARAKHVTHPAAPHQRHVAHPNASHTPQVGAHQQNATPIHRLGNSASGLFRGGPVRAAAGAFKPARATLPATHPANHPGAQTRPAGPAPAAARREPPKVIKLPKPKPKPSGKPR